MIKREQVLIFCQAPYDVPYVLTIYEQHRRGCRVSICVVNVESIHQFLGSLQLDLENLIFIPYPEDTWRLAQPMANVRLRKWVRAQYARHLGNFRGGKVFYSSNYYDWVTFAFIARLARCNEVASYQHDDPTARSPKRVSLKIHLRSWIFRYITGVALDLADTGKEPVPIFAFPYEAHGVRRVSVQPDEAVLSRYAYRVQTDTPKSILFFEVNLAGEDLVADYDAEISAILEDLRESGYEVFVKGHPRVGYTKVLDGHAVAVLPGHVPAEFIDLRPFCAVLGITTSGLCQIAEMHPEVKVVSLLNLITFRRNRQKQAFRDYLASQSARVVFVRSREELLAQLNDACGCAKA